MKDIMDVLPANTSEEYGSSYMQFKGHEFKEKSNDRRKFKEACNTFIDEVVTRLSTTFPDNNIMGDFQPLIPKDSRLLSHEEATSKI